ncbi:MAG TPA: hypothetical protein VHB98_12750 [Chloroflexota bacterium]|nr:hypothetical protein [Chloroflexota bacterium]
MSRAELLALIVDFTARTNRLMAEQIAQLRANAPLVARSAWAAAPER